VAAIAGFLAALAAEIAAIAGAFEPGGAEAAVMVAALLTQAVIVVAFLYGSQKHEERQELGLPLLGDYDVSVEGDAEIGAEDEPDTARGDREARRPPYG
jgi:hypothetical protein